MVGAMTAEVMDRKWSRVMPGVVVVVLSRCLPDSKRAGQAGNECQLFCVDLIEDCSIDKKLIRGCGPAAKYVVDREESEIRILIFVFRENGWVARTVEMLSSNVLAFV